MMNMSTTILILFLLVSNCSYCSIIFIDKDNVSGMEDGLSWATAFTEIQDGIDWAVPTDEVWVAEGIYDEMRSSMLHSPLVETGSVVLKDMVSMYGGFKGVEEERNARSWKNNKTIIDGSISRNGQPAYHVLYGASDAILDGFYIQGGNANSSEPDEPSARNGAGIYNNFNGLTLENCEIKNNIGTTNGIGIFSWGDITLKSCQFVNNQAQRGGALYVLGNSEILSCIFLDNASSEGGGIYATIGSGETALIQDCVFVGNTAGVEFPEGSFSGEGGAIHGRGAITIERCVFKDNRAWKGGGVYLRDKPLRVTNSIFWKNVGSGIYALGYVDFFTGQQTFLTTINNTFVDNVGAGVANDTASVSVANSLFWKNSASGVGASEESNIFSETNPGFFAPATGDFRITEGSPAIDTGRDFVEIDSFNPPTDDIIGTPRPLGEGYDIGAYEFDPDNPPTLPEGSGDSTCFVATAAYGTTLAGEIDVLRGFRDSRLLSNPLGSAFTDTYYRLSPPVADFIARHVWAKTVTRAILTPVIVLTQLGGLLWAVVSFFVVFFFIRRVRFVG